MLKLIDSGKGDSDEYQKLNKLYGAMGKYIPDAKVIEKEIADSLINSKNSEFIVDNPSKVSDYTKQKSKIINSIVNEYKISKEEAERIVDTLNS